MAHALLTSESPYPRVLVARGHLLDSLGISVRYSAGPSGNSNTYTELLPEEALYLLERGSLQVWTGRVATNAEEAMEGLGEWSEEEYGVRGAIELSVMEGFATFIGQDGLSWERYQVSLNPNKNTRRLSRRNSAESRHIPTLKGLAIPFSEHDDSCLPTSHHLPTCPAGQVLDGKLQICRHSEPGGQASLNGLLMLWPCYDIALLVPFDLCSQQA